jgi:predicted secreted hydrolase
MGMRRGAGQSMAPAWAPAEAVYRFEFPRDHGSHPQHKIEWWYFTGNLDTAAHERIQKLRGGAARL